MLLERGGGNGASTTSSSRAQRGTANKRLPGQRNGRVSEWVAERTFTTICEDICECYTVPMSTTTPLLLLLLALLLHSGTALKCYDCLSLALPSCLDAANSKEFDVTLCPPDEKFCSVLKMRDSQGNLIVGRQCAKGRDDGENLMMLIAPMFPETKLELESFNACDADECNAKLLSAEAKGRATSLTSTGAAFVLTAITAALLR